MKKATLHSAKVLFSILMVLVMYSAKGQISVTLTPSDYNNFHISCFGLQDGAITANPTGGTPPYTYEWSNDQNTQTATGLAAGYYNVRVYDYTGAATEVEITLNEPEQLSLETSVYAYGDYHVSCHFCADGIVSTFPVNGISPFSYYWSDGGATQNRNGIDAGVYTVLVIDNNGCTVIQEVNLIAPDREDWQMGGNSGTNPATQFIGTIDNKDLVFKTNNTERLKIKANGDLKVGSLAGTANTLVFVDDNGVLNRYMPGDDFSPVLPNPFWETIGNNNIGSDNFIGTINNAPLIFKTNVNGLGGGERMRITGGGKVGIGTDSPSEKLHLSGGNLYIGGEGSGVIIDDAAHKRIGFMKYNGKEAGIWRLYSQDFEIGRVDNSVSDLPGSPAGYTTDLYIDGDGKIGIGIGTASPSAQLHVKSTSASLMAETDHNFSYGYNTLLKVNNDETKALTVSNTNYNGSNNEVEVFQVWGDGRVAIGGDHYIPNDYKLAVHGNVIAHELVVRLAGNWPDYVFNGGYKLKTLDEINDYINQHHHLPGIPTSNEIEKSGIALGDLVTKQMQKIEELTLYLIQLNKDMQDLKKDNEILKARINKN